MNKCIQLIHQKSLKCQPKNLFNTDIPALTQNLISFVIIQSMRSFFKVQPRARKPTISYCVKQKRQVAVVCEHRQKMNSKLDMLQ